MSGFLFDQLTDFKKDLMREVKEKFPEDTKVFLKGEAKKLLGLARKNGQKEVGTSKGLKKNWSAAKSYHRGWKVGRVYKYSGSDLCIRVYNKARHSHLVEYGHANVPRGTKRATTVKGRAEQLKNRKVSGSTDGAFVLTFTEPEFKSEWLNDAEQFMYEHLKNAFEGK